MCHYFNYPIFPLRLILALILCITATGSAAAEIDSQSHQQAQLEQLAQVLPQLLVKSFKQKTQSVKHLAKIEHAQSLVILDALLNSRLYYQKANKQVVTINQQTTGYEIFDALTNQPLGIIKKQALKKITTNNKLRKTIRSLLAQGKIMSPDLATRQAAIKEILTKSDPAILNTLQTAYQQESDASQQALLALAIALIQADRGEQAERLSAIQLLASSLYPVAKGKLQQILTRNEQGEYIEKDTQVIAAAQAALKKINGKLSFFGNLETLFFGLSLGSVLLLSAIGLAITFGVMGVINMAHGEMMMLGAYTTYLIQQIMPNQIGLSLIVAIPAAFLVAGLFGIAIERGVIRHLYGRPLETLLATFGISLLLQQMVRTLISAQNVAVVTPSWLSGSLIINPAFSITYNRLYIFFFALAVFALLLMILKKTTLGLQVRAVAQNRAMATAMGIKTKWVDSLTFGLGSGVAGVAGVALSQLTNVGPNLGQAYIIDSFMVVVFGGVENIWGTLVAAMTLGVANKFLEPWAGAVMAKIIVLIFLILFIQKRPNGLFPQKGRSSGGH